MSERNYPPKRWVWLSDLIHKHGWKSGVEVGCKEGENLGYILDHCPDVRMTAVDPWVVQPGKRETYEDWDIEQVYRKFLSRISNHKDRVTVIRDFSVNAAPLVDLVDFVFIDAMHTYEACKEDIAAWRGKCRFICGHDYWEVFPGIEQAVKESFPDKEIILGPNTCWGVWL